MACDLWAGSYGNVRVDFDNQSAPVFDLCGGLSSPLSTAVHTF